MSDPNAELEVMAKNLKEKTGKDLAAWKKLAASSGETKHGRIVEHLKTAHGLGHGYANLVAHMHLGTSALNADAGDLVAEQYGGAKAAVLPVPVAACARTSRPARSGGIAAIWIGVGSS